MIPKVAIVHDYFYSFGGAEKTVEAWLLVYPEAVIYTNFINLDNFENTIFGELYHKGQLKVTKEQILFKHSRPTLFKLCFWLHPIMARFGIRIENEFNLVLVSSVYSAKYAQFPKIPIIHYCHSPTRFLYPTMRTELDHTKFHLVVQLLLKPIKLLLKKWDQQVAQDLTNSHTTWLTNSSYNQNIIEQTYQVRPKVVFPPIDIHRFNKIKSTKEQNGYIVYGRVVPIKKIERAIQACLQANEPLIVIGETPNPHYLSELKKLANNSPLITFALAKTDQDKIQLFSTTKAMIFPALEDFGIAPIEVLGAGIPVIALKGAGALEYITKENGVFIENDTSEKRIIENLTHTIKTFDYTKFQSDIIKSSVKKFDNLHTRELQTIISKVLE